MVVGEGVAPDAPPGQAGDQGDRVVAALPGIVPGAGDGPLLYTRVDLLPGKDEEPVVLEVELTEPSLFLTTSPGAADRFAQAVAEVSARS